MEIIWTEEPDNPWGQKESDRTERQNTFTFIIEIETVADFLSWTPKSLTIVIAVMKLTDPFSLEGKL